ncbi:MAG TPA: hypothetical protein VFR23_12630 [Jiangellaceae bacterium]|nr:hypothetical protein [Jiangellaceae bacterium]
MSYTDRREEIHVRYRVDGTTYNDLFACSGASVTMLRRGRTVILLTDGSDEQGPVSAAHYDRVYRILRRPVREVTDGG